MFEVDLPRPLVLAALMCAHYLVLTFNVRAVARGNMHVTAITDLVIAVLGFTLIRQVGQATGAADQAGYAVGGMIGSLVALGLSRRGRRARRRQASASPRPQACTRSEPPTFTSLL